MSLNTINPCKATMQKMSKGNCDINKISDTCYSICNSYGKVFPDMLDNCNQQCFDMITEKKQEYGFSNCSKKRPVSPVSWNQVPSLFPGFLAMYKDPKKAYDECIRSCSGSSLENSCTDRCELDFSAINDVNPISHESFNGEYSSSNNSGVSVSYILTSIVILIIIIILIRQFI